MKLQAVCTLLLALILGATSGAGAQTAAGIPPAIWTQIQALGPVVDTAGVGKIYAQLRLQIPTDGVKKTLNISYGPADAQKLDLYEPATPVSKAPVLIFVHGGAFIGGSKTSYENIGYYMARHGVIAVLPDYRLAGVILGSGLYDPSIETANPPNTAYYGADPKTYAARSTALHADAAKIPTLICEVELDPQPMVVENGAFYSQLCHRDNQCPVIYRFLQYDHISAPAAINTGDETISAPLLDFIRAR